MFVRHESFKSYLNQYPVTSTIIGINLAIFIIYKLSFFGLGAQIYAYGIGWNLLISAGDWWRLITPIFLHQNIPHVLFNSFSLFLFGPALEIILRKAKYTVAFLATGIIANIVTFYLEPSYFRHLGASGAIFGLFGIYLYLVFLRKDLIDKENAKVILVILIISLIMTFVQPNIDILAHLFGLISGFLLAPLLLKRRLS